MPYKVIAHSAIFDKECLQCIYKGRLKFIVTQSSQEWKQTFKGRRLWGSTFSVVLNSKKSWGCKSKVWMSCAKSSKVHFQAKRGQKRKKIIIPYMSSMQAFFFINIMSLSHNVFETVNSSLSLRQSSKHRNAWDERKFVFVFLFVFNGRLNFQIWHHKAKAPKSHPEGWCSLDCGRFRRGFNSFSFSITMPKKKKKKTRWNSARCKVYSISHFFPLQAQSEELRRRRKNPALFFFFFFLLSQEHGAEGGRAEAGKHSKLQKN